MEKKYLRKLIIHCNWNCKSSKITEVRNGNQKWETKCYLEFWLQKICRIFFCSVVALTCLVCVLLNKTKHWALLQNSKLSHFQGTTGIRSLLGFLFQNNFFCFLSARNFKARNFPFPEKNNIGIEQNVK